MQKIIFFTKKGYEEKQIEYDNLRRSRPDAVADLAKARAMGDLSENGYYKSARLKLSDIDRRLRQLKHVLRFGKIKEANTNGTIDIGSTVTLETEGKTLTYSIVGTYESNPSEGKISIYSPLGKLLLGTKKGDRVILHFGENQTAYAVANVQ